MNHAEDFAAPVSKEPLSAEPTRGGSYYRPVVDIVERAEELTVYVDLPGAAGDKVDVRFENGTLSIHARVEPRHTQTPVFLVEEYGVGDYFRSFQVNETVDPARIGAEFADGVLTLHLPKVEAAKPRRIDVL